MYNDKRIRVTGRNHFEKLSPKAHLLVLAKKQPLVKHSIASAYEASRFPYFLDRATTRTVSVTTERRPRKNLTA